MPVILPDGTVMTQDDGPRPGTTLEALSQLKPGLPARRHRRSRFMPESPTCLALMQDSVNGINTVFYQFQGR